MILEEIYGPDVLFVRTSTRVRVYPADAVLPADGFLPCPRGRWDASAQTHLPPLPSTSLPSAVRTDAGLRPRGHKNK
jgi:hypothetical protein